MDNSKLIDLHKSYGPAFWDDSRPHFFENEILLTSSQQEELAHHLIFLTSGTTGSPKGIALSKTALLTSAESVNAHLKVNSSGNSSDHWFLPLPLHHVGGFGIIARAFQAHTPLTHFSEKWNAQAFTEALSNSSATLTSLVPTQVHDLVQAQLPAPKKLRAILVGGGHLPLALHQQASALGWPLFPSFGMTEAASQIATAASPNPGQPLQILPHWETSTDQHHVLSIKGPALCSGILHPTLNSEGVHFIYEKSRNWLPTHDRVHLDHAKNTLTPIGRTDALVKVLGELVDLTALEKELSIRAHQEIIITALPDERRQHNLQPHAEISTPATLLALEEWNNSSQGYLRLNPLQTHATFPRTALGKIIRHAL